MSDPTSNTSAIASRCPETRPDPYAPLLALVASRGVTLYAAVGKARGMRVAMAARNTKRVAPAPATHDPVVEAEIASMTEDHAPEPTETP
jgi:hypothetical protein